MKTRKVITLIGIAIALVVLIAGLPLQAQNESVQDFEFDGLVSGTAQFKFSWKSISGEFDRDFQFKGGGITDVWTTVYINSVSQSSGKTKITTAALASDPMTITGQLNFRVRVEVCTAEENGSCSSSYKTDWAYRNLSL